MDGALIVKVIASCWMGSPRAIFMSLLLSFFLIQPTMEAGDAKETPVIVLSDSDCRTVASPVKQIVVDVTTDESSASSLSLKTTPGASPVMVEEG